MEEFTLESDYYKFAYEESILLVTYVGGPITLEIAKELVAARLKFTKGKSVLVLVDDKDLKGIDRDARGFLSSDDGVEGILAAALLSGNYFSQHLANFFLKIAANKPKIPAKVFANRNEAVKWLLQYKD